MNRLYLHLLCILTLLACACKKEVTPTETATQGQISFYFGSFALQNGVNTGAKGYRVLIDSRDSTYEPPVDASRSIYPYFIRYGNRLPVYPEVNSSWLQFMKLNTGEHQLILLDTSRKMLDSVKIKLEENTPVTLFYTDSIGYYQHLVAADHFVPDNNAISIRVINLSPFTGPVHLTFNKMDLPSLPATTRYMDNTGFRTVPVTGPQTFNIKAYPEGETGNYLARTSLETVPGHAYTLIIGGYSEKNPGSYTDPQTGETVNIRVSFSLSATKTF